MDDGGGLGGLVALGIVGYLIYLFVVYVVPIILSAAAIILGIFAVAGVLFGLGKAIMNFSSAVSKVSSRRKTMGNFKDEFAAHRMVITLSKIILMIILANGDTILEKTLNTS